MIGSALLHHCLPTVYSLMFERRLVRRYKVLCLGHYLPFLLILVANHVLLAPVVAPIRAVVLGTQVEVGVHHPDCVHVGKRYFNLPLHDVLLDQHNDQHLQEDDDEYEGIRVCHPTARSVK